MASRPQARNARSQPPARQGMYMPGTRSSPFASARVPGRVVPIPQHIRPFLDLTHVPTEDGFVPNPSPGARDDANAADDYYYKIRRLPPVRHPATNRVLSAYSGVELKADLRFSGHQFDEYIFHAARQGRAFMFRVEKQHTLLGYRYPRGHESTRCRFARCPIGGTIRSGQIRVCISEFADPRNEILDPYHNAGYAHLYCLEKYCNLPSLLAETTITFLPAVELAKELSYPPALSIAERDACAAWARHARQSWRDFKSAYPLAEARPIYKPSVHERLYHRLDQIHEANDTRNKRGHDGPQVYTYHQPRLGIAPARLQASPSGMSTPSSLQSYGPQVFQAVPGFPHQPQPPTSHAQAYNSSLNIVTPCWAGSNPTRLHANGGAAALGPSSDYSSEELGALMAQDFVDFLNSALEESPPQWPAAPPAAASQDSAGPEPGTQPRQTHEPGQVHQTRQGNHLVAATRYPTLAAGRRKSRRSSAPAVLGAQKARARKSFMASRRRPKTRGISRVWPN
ncbi:hypothetical protein KVR01_004650 [Diaporthe batatas]|uniref:uncharacterized protein n=1 Tax=Diaporthe batatas TaxID=748121 RepID=UPI001D04F470|nr:uncharacterized protein KVR01_004650 [Diaporthe batatas]KAG8166098.1 hypothetical protein KVR01_004650 [Diaporthe batatas]